MCVVGSLALLPSCLSKNGAESAINVTDRSFAQSPQSVCLLLKGPPLCQHLPRALSQMDIGNESNIFAGPARKDTCLFF